MTLTQLATVGIAQMAINESVKSQLPGRENGPADAYRHLLLSAELTRELGETYARLVLDYHELDGRNEQGYTPEAEAMDRYNNELGIEIGKRLAEDPNASWKDVVREAQLLFDPNDNNGDSSRWLPESEWKKNPKDDATGERIPNGDPRLNWPPTWSDGPFYNNPFDLGDMLNDAKGSLAGAAWDMADAISGLFNSAQGWMPPRGGDPLVLDLDRDGIETLQINTNSPVLFDHDGDGVKIATGWVKSDDGLLVLDRNGNGTIDNGSELFGDQTTVNGVKATDGFAALSAEDTNNNGIFDINDTNFNNVRVWQDLNQNGSMLVSFIKPISNNSLYKANIKKMA